MPLHDGQRRIMMYRSQDRNVSVVLYHCAQLGLMSAAAKLIEHDAGDANTRFERLIAQDQRRDTAGHASSIDHQQYGGG